MLTESDKDRVAEIFNRLTDAYLEGDPLLWKDGEPEKRLGEEYGRLLTLEEQIYASELAGQYIAHEDELRRDPVLDRIDAAEARGEGFVRRDDV